MQLAQQMTKSQEAQVYGLIAHQLEQITRIHSADVKRLTIGAHGAGAPPGWSAGAEITLNADALPDWRTVDGLAVWLGVAMHELGHCTWSPPITEFPHDLRRLFNLAEDQRQEAIVADRLPGVVGSFTQAVAQLILANPAMKASRIWPLVAGRQYLPVGLLKAIRTGAVAEVSPEWTADVYDTIAAYKALHDPGFADKEQSIALLEQLRRLLDGVGEPPIICETQGVEDPSIGGVDAEPDPNAEDGEGSGKGEGQGDGEGKGGDGEGLGEAEGAGDGSSDDAYGPDMDDNLSPGQGIGGGHVHGIQAPTAESLANAVRREAKVAKENIDATVRRQAKAVLARIRGEDAAVAPVDIGGIFKKAPSTEARLAQRRLMRSLKPLLTAAEAGLDRMTTSGRIRPDRLENGYRPDHVFDRWTLDQSDAVSAEIVVAVDVSGSMSGHMTQLAEAVWVMRQVVAKTSSKMRVLLWDTVVTEFRAPLTGQVDILAARGGTDGLRAIKTARAIFDGSRAKRKWLIVMTDGMTSNGDEILKQSNALVASGVALTVLEFGYGADGSAFTKDAGSRKQIANLQEMPEILGQMLRRVYRKNVS